MGWFHPRDRSLLVLLVLTCFAAATSLSARQNNPDIPDKLDVFPGVESVEVTRIAKDGEQEQTPLAVARYDERGRIIERESYSGGSFQWSSRFDYDDRGLLSRWRSVDEEGRIQWEYRYTYDDYGRLEREVSYDAFGDVDGMQTYEYEGLQILEEAVYGGSGALQWSRIYEYETDRTRRQWRLLYPDGGPVKTVTEYLDRFGRVVREHHRDETEQEGEVFRHDYDAAGRRVRTRVERPDGERIRTIERNYNSAGDLTEETRKEVAEGLEQKRRFQYRYDNERNWIRRLEELETHRDGSLVREEQELIERSLTYY